MFLNESTGLLFSSSEEMHNIVEADNGSRSKAKKSEQKYRNVLEKPESGTRTTLGDGVNDGGCHKGQGGARHASHQRDEQIQPAKWLVKTSWNVLCDWLIPRDGRRQYKGEQDHAHSKDIFSLQMVTGVESVLDVRLDDIHRDIELKGVGEEYC